MVDKGEPDPVVRVQTIQKPVYYVSEVLHEANARYLEKYKLIYAILIASRKLRHYFQAQSCRSDLLSAESDPAQLQRHRQHRQVGAELAEFQLDFHPRHAVKIQILADFIAEWTPSSSNSGGPDLNARPPEPKVRTPVFTEPHWTLFFDGSIRKQWAGAGVVLIDPNGDQLDRKSVV